MSKALLLLPSFLVIYGVLIMPIQKSHKQERIRIKHPESMICGNKGKDQHL